MPYGNKLKSLNVIDYEYGFSSRNAARYLKLNYLIQPFKNLMDENKIALLAAWFERKEAPVV